ncbi:MAG: FGGY-family carbohydrate kinase [Dehalococcoidia bacterium]|nr:FGGY-family carbohydrate kinase [Dehalococcoidia bacterium]
MRQTAGDDTLILSIDAGTQSVRAALVDLAGRIRHLVKTPIESYFSQRPGWAEQQPEYYWQTLCETCRRLFDAAGSPKKSIAAVTLTTQRGTYINVDRQGKALRPAILWLDQRKASTKGILDAGLVSFLKSAKLYDLVRFAVRYCRSNWVRQNEPDIWEKTHKFLGVSGYLTHRLTGEFRDSAGGIVGTMPFDVKTFNWAAKDDFTWRLFPIEEEKLPALVHPGDLLGHVTREAAEETGIPGGLPLIAASNDKACEILGAGCLTPETACISFGTIATINTQNSEYVELRPLMAPYASAIPFQFYSEVGVTRGLWMVSWFKEEFGLQERLLAAEKGMQPEELFEELMRSVPPGSMGLVLQPYWTPGPELASYAKGSIIGFGDIHTRAHLYRAIIEGVVFALKEGAQLTEEKNGVPITQVRASGGGSQSDSIMQVTADIFGLPVQRPHTHETSVVGAAIDAAVGLKLFPGFEQAVAAMTRVRDVFEPVGENVEIYRKLYERVYLKMYKRLLPLFREIQRITGYPD